MSARGKFFDLSLNIPTLLALSGIAFTAGQMAQKVETLRQNQESLARRVTDNELANTAQHERIFQRIP